MIFRKTTEKYNFENNQKITIFRFRPIQNIEKSLDMWLLTQDLHELQPSPGDMRLVLNFQVGWFPQIDRPRSPIVETLALG